MTVQDATFDVVNPATGEVFAQAPRCSREALDEAFERARDAQLSWREDEQRRRESLARAADLLAAAADEIAPTVTAEQGRPRHHAPLEATFASRWLRYFAELELEPEVIQDDDDARVEIVRRPHGVVAAITPWNFPLVLACWKLGPALRAGNSVVLKPSPFTPLSTLKMVEVMNEALPPGVLQAVTGTDELGGWMTSHPIPRKISFTGSVATGSKVALAAAADFKRVTLELGGNDAAIVLDDGDPAEVAAGIFQAAFLNTGQVCSAIKRVYVPESLHAPVVDALSELARAAVVGDPLQPDTELGPLTTRLQYERVKGLVADALGAGGKATVGGAPLDGPGYFFAPTIVTGVAEGVGLVDEEQFGPALPVMSYRTVDEAVARANDTRFGLGGSVWSADPERGAEVASRLECGTSWVNTHLAIGPSQPFAGSKSSGLGVENGPWGLKSYTDISVLYRSK